MRENFEKNKGIEKAGKITGFLIMYLIFTTVFYFLFKILDKIPENWNYFYIMNITLFIVLIGGLLKAYLR